MSLMSFLHSIVKHQPTEAELEDLRARVEASEKEAAVLHKINEKLAQLKVAIKDVNEGKVSEEAVETLKTELAELNKMMESIQDIREGK